ncbi:MAG: DUF1853 family protein [Saccharospirillum sp.]
MSIITEGLRLNEPAHHAVVQDLIWVCHAPPLLALNNSWTPRAELGDIDFTALTPEHLHSLYQARQGKLGAYFEALACAVITCSQHYRLLAQGVVIQGQHRTLGELDLLLQHRASREIVHLELAMKFYLKVPDCPDGAANWIGPGLRDFLHLKYHHLSKRQLTLPERALEANAWPVQLPFPDRSLAWVTGRLYYPWPEQPTGPEPLIATGHLHSQWLTRSTFQCHHFEGQWLRKAHWLSGAVEGAPGQPSHGLPAQWLGNPARDRAIDTPDRHWFIVPDDWLARARHSLQQRFD